MTHATIITDRAVDALGNLIDQFKGQVNIEAFIHAWAHQSEDVEQAGFGILELTSLATAEGVQLDGLGTIVGTEREGRTDADYRIRLGAQILLNNSSGTIEELLQIAVALGATSVTLTEVFPAKIEIECNVPIVNGVEVARVMGLAKPAGVGRWFTWYESATPFTFDTVGLGLDQGELGEAVTGSP